MSKVWIWTPNWSHERVAKSRCRASVANGRMGLAQCSRKATTTGIVDGATYGFCKQHHPDAKKKRDEVREAKWAAEERARAHARRKKGLQAKAFNVLAELKDDDVALVNGGEIAALRRQILKWLEEEG